MPPPLMRRAGQAGGGARPTTGSAHWELKEPTLLNTCLLSLGFRGVGKDENCSREEESGHGENSPQNKSEMNLGRAAGGGAGGQGGGGH